MTDFSDVVNEGYVSARKFGRWKKSWLILCQASSRGPNRLEKYPDENSAAYQVNGKTIPLQDVRDISMDSSNQKRVFTLWFKDNTSKNFACDSHDSASQWVQQLRKLRWQEEGHSLHGSNPRAQAIFHVSLLPNCLLHHSGESKLQVTKTEMVLLNLNSVRLASWPLTCLRRYGGDNSKFTFECGRSCETGEGTFILNTHETERIKQCISKATTELLDTPQ